MRYPVLDALRGVAAFAVVTHHCVLAGLIPIPPGLPVALSRYTPLHLFVNGRAPVILFFVLSGFVLAVALERNAEGTLAIRFAARRLCRIYLPYAAVVLIAAALERASAPFALPATGWAARLWAEPASAGLVLRQLAMPAIWADLTLDRVAWSLVHEIRVSLLFPWLLLAGLRAPVSLAIGSIALFALGHYASGCDTLACLPFNGTDTATSFAATAYFVPFFVLGLLLALHRGRCARWVPRSNRVLWLAWTLAVYGAIVPFKFEILPDAATGLAAAAIVLLALGGAGPAAALFSPPLLWLGRVSFSLYLGHLLVLALVLRLGAGLPGPIELALAIGGSLVAAELLYRAVEAPCLRLSRRLGGISAMMTRSTAPAREQELAWTPGKSGP